jgi:hypothetical protein
MSLPVDSHKLSTVGLHLSLVGNLSAIYFSTLRLAIFLVRVGKEVAIYLLGLAFAAT